MKILWTFLFPVLIATATPAWSEEWKSVSDKSSIAFGSIKNDTTGEVHHFQDVDGTVSETGKMTININLASIETNIDIRNERMNNILFQEGKASATLSGDIDMDEVSNLKLGDTKVMEIQTTLSFLGIENDIDANVLVARLSDNRVLVTTSDFIMLSTEDLGIDDGITKLMEIAKLPSITRVTPVSARMVFEK